MRVLFVSLVVCTVAALSLAGQSQRAPSLVVEGQVVDAGGGAIAGATVELTRPAVPARTATSDAAGRFRFRSVAPGQYELTITHSRFAALTQTVMVPADATSPVALTVTLHATASSSPPARQAQRTAEGALAAPADAIREEGRAGRGGAA